MTPAADDGTPEPGSDRTAADLADVLALTWIQGAFSGRRIAAVLVGLAERGLLRATYDPQSRHPLWFDSPPGQAGGVEAAGLDLHERQFVAGFLARQHRVEWALPLPRLAQAARRAAEARGYIDITRVVAVRRLLSRSDEVFIYSALLLVILAVLVWWPDSPGYQVIASAMLIGFTSLLLGGLLRVVPRSTPTEAGLARLGHVLAHPRAHAAWALLSDDPADLGDWAAGQRGQPDWWVGWWQPPLAAEVLTDFAARCQESVERARHPRPGWADDVGTLFIDPVSGAGDGSGDSGGGDGGGGG